MYEATGFRTTPSTASGATTNRSSPSGRTPRNHQPADRRRDRVHPLGVDRVAVDILDPASLPEADGRRVGVDRTVEPELRMKSAAEIESSTTPSSSTNTRRTAVSLIRSPESSLGAACSCSWRPSPAATPIPVPHAQRATSRQARARLTTQTLVARDDSGVHSEAVGRPVV